MLEKKLAEKEEELKLLAEQNTEGLAPIKKKSIKVNVYSVGADVNSPPSMSMEL